MDSSRVLVKDGGFGTQITMNVGEGNDGDPLWSARYNATNPAAVIKTHLDFLQNGADIILTNTYQASVDGFNEFLNLDFKESIELIRSTVRLAHIAKEKYLTEALELPDQPKRNPMIVASIGPYGAHLHDGSEYTGSYVDYVPAKNIVEWHRSRIQICLEAGVDALAIETIPALIEAKVLVEMLCVDYQQTKFWISFQCKDDKSLAHGEDFAEASITIWKLLKKHNALKNCLAIGVNCIHPKFVTPLFRNLNAKRVDEDKIPLIVYPNSGETYDVKKGWMGREHCMPLESYVFEWTQLGAKIIGGCCRTYARDILQISKAVNEVNQKKK